MYLNVSRWIRLIACADADSRFQPPRIPSLTCESNSVSLLLKTLLWLSLFSFVMKFGLMVQISQLWQFLLFLFPLLITLQLFKLQQKQRAALWGQFIVFMGSFIAVTNPPSWDYADFLNTTSPKCAA